jgi:hypothetical protein
VNFWINLSINHIQRQLAMRRVDAPATAEQSHFHKVGLMILKS